MVGVLAGKIDGGVVAVIGPEKEATICDLEAAVEVGRLLAKLELLVITGGLSGVMEQVAKGVREENGVVVGILPEQNKNIGNKYLTLIVPSSLGELRNILVVSCADAVLAVGGSFGTLSEVALALRQGIPVVSLNGWKISDANGQNIPLLEEKTPTLAVNRIVEILKAKNKNLVDTHDN